MEHEAAFLDGMEDYCKEASRMTGLVDGAKRLAQGVASSRAGQATATAAGKAKKVLDKPINATTGDIAGTALIATGTTAGVQNISDKIKKKKNEKGASATEEGTDADFAQGIIEYCKEAGVSIEQFQSILPE